MLSLVQMALLRQRDNVRVLLGMLPPVEERNTRSSGRSSPTPTTERSFGSMPSLGTSPGLSKLAAELEAELAQRGINLTNAPLADALPQEQIASVLTAVQSYADGGLNDPQLVDLVNGVRYNLGMLFDEGGNGQRSSLTERERIKMNRAEEIAKELSEGVFTDEQVEAECRMMDVLVKSFMEELLEPSDIVRFAQTLGSSAEGRTHYMLDEIDWVKMLQDLVTDVYGSSKAILNTPHKGDMSAGGGRYDFDAGVTKFGLTLWAQMNLCAVLLEASPHRSLSTWLEDPFTMGDWVIKKLKDWEAATGGYDQEGDEDTQWFSTAELVLDIPTAYLPKTLRQAFALAAASLWGEG